MSGTSGSFVPPNNVRPIWPGATTNPPPLQPFKWPLTPPPPDHSGRIADALERIAASLEQMHLTQEEREALKTMRAMRR